MRRSPLLISILAALSGCSDTEEGKACLAVPAEQTTCPAAASVNLQDLFTPDRCGWEIVDVKGNGVRQTVPTQADPMLEACCYTAELVEETPGCVIGRPYFDEGTELRAPLRSGAAPFSAAESSRAAAWALAGSGEHASVAAFSRLALELLRLGAPLELLRGVHQAALDELDHAAICWRLAELFGAARVSAGPFPVPDTVALSADLAALAHAAVREGCLAETLGAHVVSIAAEVAPEPAVRAGLQSIAADEAVHAVLSFRIVAWALRVGGPDVRAAVAAALAAPWPRLDIDELALRANVDAARLHAASQQGITEVLRPATARLLAA